MLDNAFHQIKLNAIRSKFCKSIFDENISWDRYIKPLEKKVAKTLNSL